MKDKTKPALFILHPSAFILSFQWVGRDSNPRTPKRPDLQSGAIDRSATYPELFILTVSTVGGLAVGLEPTTCGLQNRCSTN